MRVLLDTNIVLDYLGANRGFTEDVDKVFDLAARRIAIKKCYKKIKKVLDKSKIT